MPPFYKVDNVSLCRDWEYQIFSFLTFLAAKISHMTLPVPIRSTISEFSQKLVTPGSRGSAESRVVTHGDIGSGYRQGPETAVGALVGALCISRASWGDQGCAVISVSLQYTNYWSDFGPFSWLQPDTLSFVLSKSESVSEARRDKTQNDYYTGLLSINLCPVLLEVVLWTVLRERPLCF